MEVVEEEFTTLTSVANVKRKKVERVLPRWLSSPSVISSSFNDLTHVDEIKGLDEKLVEKLKKNDIHHFFPVQSAVLPCLLKNALPARDICVSAPTGSGKTLAFVLPIIQILKRSLVTSLRTLVVLPTRELAIQVYKVFQTYSEGTRIKVGLVIGHTTFQVEQNSLVQTTRDGLRSAVDIVVATPGRLVDHITKTDGFSLKDLKFLVIDEADRMISEIKHDWLNLIEQSYAEKFKNKNVESYIKLPGVLQTMTIDQILAAPLTAASCHFLQDRPQKLLFSATLTSDPQNLQRLKLFQPKLFTTVMMTEDKTEGKIHGDECQNVGNYITPAELKESYIICKIAKRPLLLCYLLEKLKYRGILCFTKSVENNHRLYLVMKKMCQRKGIRVAEFSSELSSDKRISRVNEFSKGNIDILITTDAIARGIDFHNVNYVISFTFPNFIKTYIHRIGRTARAGKKGEAITFLDNNEMKVFKKKMATAGKTVERFRIKPSKLTHYEDTFATALNSISDKVKRKSSRKK